MHAAAAQSPKHGGSERMRVLTFGHYLRPVAECDR
jgi:hypothetical protein